MRTEIDFRIRSIHHGAFATSNLDETIRFWRDLLGFRVLFGLGKEDEKQYFFGLSDHFTIAFFEWDGVEPLPYKRHGEPVTGPFGFDHLAMEMESEEDLYRLQDQLLEAEVPVSDVIDHGFIHSIYTYDPNGIPLEFNALQPGVSLSRHPLMADPSPPPAAREGQEPMPGHWPEVKGGNEPERPILPGDGHGLFGD